MSADLIGFTLVAAALVASPGPDSLLIVQNTLARGLNAGILTVAGVQAGLIMHMALSVLGLSVLLYHSETWFRVLSIIGAIYLTVIGWVAVKGATQSLSLPDSPVRQGNAFRQGALCNLLNPKVLILFISIMPGFVNLDAGQRGWQIIALAAILLGINTPFQLALAVVTDRLRNRTGTSRWRILFRQLCGGVIILFGVVLFVEQLMGI